MTADHPDPAARALELIARADGPPWHRHDRCLKFALAAHELLPTLAREVQWLREDVEARRHSLAQEIRGCLESRGAKWVPSSTSSDLIPAVGAALDALRAEVEKLRARVALLMSESVEPRAPDEVDEGVDQSPFKERPIDE